MLRIVSTILLVGGFCWILGQMIRATVTPRPGDTANRLIELGSLFVLFGSAYSRYDAPDTTFTGGGLPVMIAGAVTLWVPRRQARSSAATCPLCRESVNPRAPVCRHCRSAMQPITAEGLPVGQSPDTLAKALNEEPVTLLTPPEKQ